VALSSSIHLKSLHTFVLAGFDQQFIPTPSIAFLQTGLRSVRPIIQIISADSLIRISQLHLLNMQTILKEILLLQPFQNPRLIQ
jgi:hypothetical protein